MLLNKKSPNKRIRIVSQPYKNILVYLYLYISISISIIYIYKNEEVECFEGKDFL